MTSASAALTGVGGGKVCSQINDFGLNNNNNNNIYICWRRRSASAAAAATRRRLVFSTTRASSSSPPDPPNDDNNKKQLEEDGNGIVDDANNISVMKRLVDVNPVGLGRRSRQIFDEAWRKFSELGQISRTTRINDNNSSLFSEEGGPMCEFAIPGAQNTTVLVVGATSRVGRIVVRKLMLRGYSVKALVRNADQQVVDMLPTSVKVVIGDVGDPATLRLAVEGCNKIIYCATARSSITVDLNRVDHQGVYNLSKAFQVLFLSFLIILFYSILPNAINIIPMQHTFIVSGPQQQASTIASWKKAVKASFCLQSSSLQIPSKAGMSARELISRMQLLLNMMEEWMLNLSSARAEKQFFQVHIFRNTRHLPSGESYVFTRGGYVELSTKLSLPLGSTLDRYEGLILSVGGNGRSYVLILESGPSADTSQSNQYFSRISTKVGFCRVRVPFTSFRPVNPADPPLDPFLIHTLTIRFEPRRQRSAEGPVGTNQDMRSFQMILEYIKALPTGQETDFILVSCTGSGIDSSRREQVLRAKKAGEDSLRRSGLGYTIIRPGPLMEEPGGQRALIFDQGNRISQGISCADVADICVKALHDSTARNKSFDVCYEYVAEPGKELYELVAHLPDKANNYLTPALSALEKNT
ncbi:hypothetical protein OSB04_004444 [Centaurea solstitialis]|uniref:Uncharacterized protein n=1 Tax=Centaurea solstitialis TaxID=347529 RepID=A0AA38UDU7_9ASTR|nr:hypothetical protein OSB04_004444 [Centaurea solstitialis]